LCGFHIRVRQLRPEIWLVRMPCRWLLDCGW
jgi:hypothetical protein